LNIAGFRTIDRHEIAKEKNIEELNVQLVSMVGHNDAEMIVSVFITRGNISSPEMA